MKTTIYLVFILLFSCSSQEYKLQEQAMKILNNDCQFINANLGEKGHCKFEIYKNYVPLQLSMFNEKIIEFDSFKDIAINKKFEILNLYDLEQSSKQEEPNNFSNNFKNELNGYLIVFSKRDKRIFSCEIFINNEYEYSYKETTLGASIQYLFETDKSVEQILKSSKILIHNN